MCSSDLLTTLRLYYNLVESSRVVTTPFWSFVLQVHNPQHTFRYSCSNTGGSLFVVKMASLTDFVLRLRSQCCTFVKPELIFARSWSYHSLPFVYSRNHTILLWIHLPSFSVINESQQNHTPLLQGGGRPTFDLDMIAHTFTNRMPRLLEVLNSNALYALVKKIIGKGRSQQYSLVKKIIGKKPTILCFNAWSRFFQREEMYILSKGKGCTLFRGGRVVRVYKFP